MTSTANEGQLSWTNESLLLIAETARRVTELQNMERLAREVVLAVKEAFSYDFISLLVVDKQANDLVKVEVQGLSRNEHVGMRRPVVDRPEAGVVGWVAFHGCSALIPDVDLDPRYIKSVPGAAAELAVPLKIGNDVIGVLDVESVTRNGLDENDRFVLEALGHQIAIAIENARLYEELAQTREDLQVKAGQLEQLLGRTVDVQEEERRRIARDLHDSVTQLLIGSRYQINAARINIRRDQAQAEKALVQAEELLKQCIEEMQFLIHNLRPALLDDLGLHSALERYTSTLARSSTIDFEFTSHGARRQLSPQAETAVYRVIQEALWNAVRHSRGRHVRVGFDYQPDRLVVEVTDDGHGFDRRARAVSGEALGLTSMEERSKSVSGVFQIRSERGRGTSVRLEVPAE
jgi:signal transduction histidine kinase